jgi:hypothetical protein
MRVNRCVSCVADNDLAMAMVQLIDTAASIVGTNVTQQSQRYLILLIITDGEISGMCFSDKKEVVVGGAGHH